MIWLLGGYMWLFIHRPFEVWPALGTLQIERIYAILMILVWVMTPGKRLAPSRTHVGLGLFALAVLVTWAASPYATSPGSMTMVENFFKVTVIYFLIVTSVRREADLRLLLLLFLGSIALYMSHSLYEYINGRAEYRMGIRRMVGVDISFYDSNAFSAGLVFALPMTLPFWAERPRRVPLAVLAGYTGVSCLCILLTGSRTAFLVLLAFGGLTVLTFVRRKALALAVLAVCGAAFLGLLSVALPDELVTRYTTIIDPSVGPRNAQESAEGRVAGFQAGLDLFGRYPLTGAGPGSFLAASSLGMQPHNLAGQVLGEMGVVGAAVLLVLCLCFLLNWLEGRRLWARLRALSAEVDPGADVWAAPTRAPAPPFAYYVTQAAGIAALLLLLQGLAGHNLYRFHWQWFAAFQAVAVGCLRVRVADARRALELAALHLTPPQTRPGPRRAALPTSPRR